MPFSKRTRRPSLRLGLQDVLEQDPAGLARCRRASRFGLDVLEHEVRRVDLAMRMRVGDADHLALVLEDQDVVDSGEPAQIDVLLAARPP